MKPNIIPLLACPSCRGDLALISGAITGRDGRVKESGLNCKDCSARYPIVNYIPRFVPTKNYASTFGFQWESYSKTQIDKLNGSDISHERFRRQTKWGEDLEGERVLEVGCGAGRFTEVALDTGAEVFSVDYSAAVDVNLENNGPHDRLHLFQADIYALPFKAAVFDKVFCIGVLQHTPDVRGSFMELLPPLKLGGEVSIDVYARTLESRFMPKYWLRPLTKRMPPAVLYGLVRRVVPVLLPVKAWLRGHVPKVGRYVAGAIPVTNYYGAYDLTPEQHLQWATLDTLDALSPAYDTPQTLEQVDGWFRDAGLHEVDVRFVSTGIVGGNGTVPRGDS